MKSFKTITNSYYIYVDVSFYSAVVFIIQDFQKLHFIRFDEFCNMPYYLPLSRVILYFNTIQQAQAKETSSIKNDTVFLIFWPTDSQYRRRSMFIIILEQWTKTNYKETAAPGVVRALYNFSTPRPFIFWGKIEFQREYFLIYNHPSHCGESPGRDICNYYKLSGW